MLDKFGSTLITDTCDLNILHKQTNDEIQRL